MQELTIAIDDTTAARAAAVLPAVRKRAPRADLEYVYRGAVGVGLNRLCEPSFGFTAADFAAPEPGALVVAVNVDAADVARATFFAVELDTDIGAVLSAALCTGLEKLIGGKARLVGPFQDAPAQAQGVGHVSA